MENSTVDSPIFIVGPLRSGTTLLRLLIANHPRISGIGEFEESVSQIVDGQWPELNEYYRFLENDRMFQDNGYSIDKSLSYEDLVRSFLLQAYEKQPNDYISGSIHSHFDELPAIWPNAKYIHLLRDPRDVARSCIGMGWVGNVWYGADYWTAPEKRWVELTKKVNPECLLEVRYEELVCKPEEVLTKICSFLGIEYSEEMPKIDKTSTYARPDASFSEQWRTKLSLREVELVEIKCKELMIKQGYAISEQSNNHKVSKIERLRLYIQNRIVRWSFNSKRWGFKLWFNYNIAKRIGPRRWYERLQNDVNNKQRMYLK